MQAFLSLYFLTVLSGSMVILGRAGLRNLPRIGAALARREARSDGPGFWARGAMQQQIAAPRLQPTPRSR